MKLKLQEGLLTLLYMDKSFYPTLFDFTGPWKIDIINFLNENYMYDLSIGEIALYTGRSLLKGISKRSAIYLPRNGLCKSA